MEIITLTTGYMESHCYLVAESGHAVVIDPGEAGTILKMLQTRELKTDFGVLTHEHCDHIHGCTELQEELRIPFYACQACDRNMRNEKMNFSRYFDAFIGVQTKLCKEEQVRMPAFSARADRTFDGELSLNWRGHELRLRETPGHSPGSICILVDRQWLFSGDTLLGDDLTNLRFSGGSREELEKETIPWLRTLAGETIVYPGHGSPFILGERLKKVIVESEVTDRAL